MLARPFPVKQCAQVPLWHATTRMLVTLNLVPQPQENVLPPQYHVMTKICVLKIRVQRFQEKQFANLPPHLATTPLATQELVIPKPVFAQELPFYVAITTFAPLIPV